jgi:hypothetical protein
VSTEVDRVVVYKKTALVNHLKAPRLSGCVCSAKAKSVYEMWMSSIIKLELSLEIQGHLYGYAQAACDRPAVRRGIKPTTVLYQQQSNGHIQKQAELQGCGLFVLGVHSFFAVSSPAFVCFQSQVHTRYRLKWK